jgi:chromosome segregation ATPase
MRKYEPAFGTYLDSYRELSEPLRVAASRFGKALTGTEANAPNYFAAPAQSLPGRAFSSPENVRGLMDALGGREPVLAAAERYFATQLVGKTAAEARQFLGRDNIRSVLEVLGPEFRAQINSRFLEGATRQAETATSATATATRLRQEVTVLEREIKSLEQEINRIAPVRENVNRDLANIRNALNSADRNKFSSQLLSRIENELDSRTYTRMTNLVNQYKTAATQQQEAVRRLRGYALKAGAAVGLGGFGTYYYGGR